MKARCVGPGRSRVPSPSSVVTSRPCAAFTGITQERAATPSISTVQAPHSPRPQPYFGPFSARSLRSTSNSDVVGGAATRTAAPLTFRPIGSAASVAECSMMCVAKDPVKEGRRARQAALAFGSTSGSLNTS